MHEPEVKGCHAESPSSNRYAHRATAGGASPAGGVRPGNGSHAAIRIPGAWHYRRRRGRDHRKAFDRGNSDGSLPGGRDARRRAPRRFATRQCRGGIGRTRGDRRGAIAPRNPGRVRTGSARDAATGPDAGAEAQFLPQAARRGRSGRDHRAAAGPEHAVGRAPTATRASLCADADPPVGSLDRAQGHRPYRREHRSRATDRFRRAARWPRRRQLRRCRRHAGHDPAAARNGRTAAALSRIVHPAGRRSAQGCAAARTARHRQDAPGAGGRERIGCRILHHQRPGDHGLGLRRIRKAAARGVRGGDAGRPGHHLHRRDRFHRAQAATGSGRGREATSSRKCSR